MPTPLNFLELASTDIYPSFSSSKKRVNNRIETFFSESIRISSSVGRRDDRPFVIQRGEEGGAADRRPKFPRCLRNIAT